MEVTLAAGRACGPVKVDGDGVVITEDVSISLKELGALVVEVTSIETRHATSTIKHLVYSLAGVDQGWVAADRLDSRHNISMLEDGPSIPEPTLRRKYTDVVSCSGVSRVGITEHDNGVTSGPIVDVVGKLLDVGSTRYLIPILGPGSAVSTKTIYPAGEITERYLPSIGMQIVHVNPNSIGYLHTHKCETFGSQTISPRRIGAILPFRAGKINPGKVAEGVHSGTNACSSSGRSSVRVSVGGVDIGMVIEIL